MAKTKDKVSDAASNVKPYVDRALHDDELRDNVRNAYESARSIYNELIGNRGVTGRRDTRRDRQGHPGRAPVDDRRAAQGGRPRAGQGGAQGPQRRPALPRHRARHPVQPAHRPADPEVALRPPASAAATTSRIRAATAGTAGRLDRSTACDHRLGGGLLRLRDQRPSVTLRLRRRDRALQRLRVEPARGRDVATLQQDRAGLRRGRRRTPASSRRPRRSARPAAAPSASR